MSAPAMAPVVPNSRVVPSGLPDGAAIAAVFATAFAVAWFLAGNVFTFTNDEGIYLEGARGILEGKALYRDHFAFTGPGTYWLITLSFKLFGVTLAAARIPFVLDMAITTAFAYWCVARTVSRRSGVFAAVVCFAIQIANPSMQNANHRWDSAAFVCLAVMAACRSKAGWLAAFSSGGFAAAAAWCSPPVLFAVGVLGVWQWTLRRLLWFLAGGAACSALSLAILAMSGSLPYLLPSLLWASQNYSDANRVPYGFLIGGIGNLFAGSGVEFVVVTAVIVSAMLAPAIGPVLNVFSAARILRGPRELLWMATCSLALVASTYPRVDAAHLTNVFAPTLVVSVWVLSQLKVARYAGAVIGTASLMLLSYTVRSAYSAERLETRIGVVRGEARDSEAIKLAQSSVKPGESLFVYPYLPMMYFVTGAVNPTQYSFLQPGMMTGSDEMRVLDQLKRNPPQHVLFCLVNPDDLLRIWPNSDKRRLRMPALERWIQSNYTAGSTAGVINGYTLYRRDERQKAPGSAAP